MSTDCWVKYKFKYDTTWSSCDGEQYVRYTGYLEGQIVGVTVCKEV